MDLNKLKELLKEWQETNMPQGVNIIIQGVLSIVAIPTLVNLVESIEQTYIVPLADQLNQAAEQNQIIKAEAEEIRKRYKRAITFIIEKTVDDVFWGKLTIEKLDKIFMDDSMFDEKGHLKNG